MKKIALPVLIFCFICSLVQAQQPELSLKVAVIPLTTMVLHYSAAIEFPALGNFTSQTTYNYLKVYDTVSEYAEITNRKSLMQEVRYYITPVKSVSSSRIYVFLYPRISYNKRGNEGSSYNPIHNEFEYGAGGGAGFKFVAKRNLYLDFNLGYSWFNTETDIKIIDRIYTGWLPKLNLHLCYRIGLCKVKKV
ncbi:MAG: hypothetical protein FJY07_05340 [Bacteroidetes bacterium]|nr:hypothetical protein [Bacteroidota bacterium]